MNLFSPTAMGITGAVIAVLLIVIFIIKRYRVAKPDEAIVVTGRAGKTTSLASGEQVQSGQRVVIGGGTFVWPFVQKATHISLASRRLDIVTIAQDSRGVTVKAQAVATVKIGSTVDMVKLAAQRFLSQEGAIKEFSTEVLSGSLRGIIGGLTVEQIIKDRESVASAVLSAAEEALTKQGLSLDVLQIQEIADDQGYIENLGKPDAARVRQAAQIADIEAEQLTAQRKIDADKAVAEKQRELSLYQSQVKSETDTAAANASAQQPIADAKNQQIILEQQQLAAQKQAELRQAQLQAEVLKVADANAYQIETIAKANANAAVLQADAEKQKRVLAAEAVRAEGLANAAATQAEGEAEGAAIKAKADGLAAQSQAVLAQQLIGELANIAREFALPLSSNPDITIISSDGSGSGANALTAGVAGGMATMNETLKKTLGIDLGEIITGRAVGHGMGEGIEKAGKA